jgi:hypothetical protein
MPKSIYKSANSLQNVILLLLFVIGLFVLYRYVKTIETETKMLHNHLIELTEKIQFMSACPMPPPPGGSSYPIPNSSCPMPGVKNIEENAINPSETIAVHEDDNDDESIKSEDITAMLKKVMGGGASVDDECIDNIMIQVACDEMTDMMGSSVNPSSTVIEDITDKLEEDKAEDPVEVDDNKNETADDAASTKSNNVLNLDDTFENTRDTLMRKTNEELKGLLKQQQLPIKGSKQELVDRLMNSA